MSGRRFGAHAGEAFAGACVPPESGSSTSSSTTGVEPLGTSTSSSTGAPQSGGETSTETGELASTSTGTSGSSSSESSSGGPTEEVCDLVDNDLDGLIDEVSESNDECGGCLLTQFDGVAVWNCNVDAVAWQTAAATCAGFGAELARVDASSMQQELAALSNGARYWIGANDLRTEGQWVWTDGAAVDYDNWQMNQPDNGAMIPAEQDCALLAHWGTSAEPGGWDDGQCTEELDYFCTAPHAL